MKTTALVARLALLGAWIGLGLGSARAANVTWEGDVSGDFWDNNNCNAVPVWASDTAYLTGAGSPPVLSASGSVWRLVIQTTEGQ